MELALLGFTPPLPDLGENKVLHIYLSVRVDLSLSETIER